MIIGYVSINKDLLLLFTFIWIFSLPDCFYLRSLFTASRKRVTLYLSQNWTPCSTERKSCSTFYGNGICARSKMDGIPNWELRTELSMAAKPLYCRAAPMIATYRSHSLPLYTASTCSLYGSMSPPLITLGYNISSFFTSFSITDFLFGSMGSQWRFPSLSPVGL